MENFQRNIRFDNFKGLLIFLVVFGHFIEGVYAFRDNNEYIRVVYSFIYLFHMPAFVFISGYFSKKNDTIIFEKVLKNQIIPLCIFQFFYEIFNKLFFHSFTGATLCLSPYWLLWYFLSLASWKLLFQLLYKIRFFFLVSIIFALGAGMVNSLGESLSISRTIVFFPFFILGNICSEKNYFKHDGKDTACFISSLWLLKFLSVCVLIITFLYVSKMNIPRQIYYNMCSYEACGIPWKKGIVLRFVNLILSTFCIFSILILIPKKNSLVSIIGRNSLIPFIMHGFLLRLLVIRPISIYSNLYFVFIGGAVFSFLVVYLCGTDQLSALYDKELDKVCSILIKENCRIK